MQDNRLKITHVVIRDFGSVHNFEGNFSDVVLIEGDYYSEKLRDILCVIRDFMNIGLLVEEGQDFEDDFVFDFNSKFKKRTYIEIGFTFDEHTFCYRHFYDIDGNMERYVRDTLSRFTMRGKLLYEFMNYIMNPYAMNIANVTTVTGEGNTIEYFQDEFLRIWHCILEHEEIEGINNVLDFAKTDYDLIRSEIQDKYADGIMLTYDMSVKLEDDKLVCYKGDVIVSDIDALNRREKKAYYFANYLLANEVLTRVVALESEALINCPMVVDAELYWDMEEGDVIALIKRYLLTLNRQLFIVESTGITRLLWENEDIKAATVITDNGTNVECVTRALF